MIPIFPIIVIIGVIIAIIVINKAINAQQKLFELYKTQLLNDYSKFTDKMIEILESNRLIDKQVRGARITKNIEKRGYKNPRNPPRLNKPKSLKRARFTLKQKKEIRNLAKEGHSASNIAQLMDVPLQRIYNFLWYHRIKYKKYGPNKNTNTTLKE